MTVYRVMSELSSNKYLVAVSNVFIMALPLALISTFCELIAIFSEHYGYDSLTGTIRYVGESTGLMFPILINFYLVTYLSSVKRIPKGVSIASALTVYFVVSYQWGFLSQIMPLPNSFPLSLLTAYITCELISRLKKFRIFRGSDRDSVIDSSANMLLGAIVSIGALITFSQLIYFVVNSVSIPSSLLPSLDPTSFVDGLIYELLRGAFWSVGINGHNVLHMYKAELYDITMVNISAWHNFGVDLNIISTNFYDFFTGIGGSGNLLSLVICMLLFAKSEGYKVLAKASLILCLFNVNEPVLYGVPVIFNPIMIIPFLVAPAIGFVVAYGAMYWGIVPPLSEIQSWLMPPLLSGYVATGGAISGAILQAVIILIGVAIYYPFFKVMDKRNLGIGVSDVFSNRLFTSDEIEVKTRLTSFIPSLHQNLKAQKEIERLQAEGEFLLYFQPQVDVNTNKIISFETLIRYQNNDGKILPPTFLSAFNQLGLMPDLDYWVFDKALRAGERFAKVNENIRLSINISPDTVLSKNFVQTIKTHIEESSLSFSQIEIEITEELLVQNEADVAKVIDQLHELGIAVALDDFGTGYSSLAYLSRFDFDKVKIDRTLVLNLETQRGKDLFSLAVQLGKITNAEIVVEGVEHLKEVEFVQSVGVRYIQGFYYYRPMSQQDIFANDLLQDFVSNNDINNDLTIKKVTTTEV
ncbi:EAL domain-containing protein [Photobacterium angustum]|uniref:Diguanylate phosphodiesterase n=1 Tax=Photobacterium angustum TaxID=661 RepID=A0A2S7VJQ4_PHOAN|nr:EAL domain-containing protein [Photobacterium angustum]PQJ62185.1 diguanylate phosphodiesterase [Photobacterium angustum]